MAKDKRPALQFYIGDWKKDPELRACSLAARGLWVDMICIMYESERRGYLLVRNRPPTTAELARNVGADAAEVRTLLAELENAGVYSIVDGVIVCRRMVRDAELSEKNKANGSKGGNPSLKRGSDNRGVGSSDNPPLIPPSAKTDNRFVEDEDEEEESCSLSSGSKGLEPFEADPPAKLGPGMPGFTQFMNAYPRHRLDGDGTNRRLWIEMNCEPNAAAILAGLEAHKASGKWQEAHGQFVPKASNFLKEDTWNRPPMEATNGPDHRNQSHRRPSPEDARRAADRAQRVGGGEVGPIPILGRRGAG
jgi:hypothetical protein